MESPENLRDSRRVGSGVLHSPVQIQMLAMKELEGFSAQLKTKMKKMKLGNSIAKQ